MNKYQGAIAAWTLCALAAAPVFGQTSSGSGPSTSPGSPSVTRPGGSSAPSEGRMPGAVQPGIRQDDRATGQPRMGSDTKGSDTKGSDTKGSDTSSSGMPSSGSTGSSTATPGMSGTQQNANTAQVRQVQEALKAQGHDPGAIDGMLGSQTQEALRAFQKSQDLPVTGQLDSKTIEKLGVR